MANVSIENVLGKLQSLQNSSQFQESVSQSIELLENTLVATTSKFGSDITQIEGGFQALTQSVDDVVSSLDFSIPVQNTGNLDIVQMTKDVPGVKEKLITKVEDAKTDLDAIIGTAGSATDGFLKVNISSGLPEAVGQVLSNAGVPPGDIRNVVKNFQDLEDDVFEKIERSTEDILNNILGPIVNITTGINQLKNNVFATANALTQNLIINVDEGLGSVIENITENITGNGKAAIQSIITKGGGKKLSSKDVSLILKYVGDTEYNKAAAIIQNRIPNTPINDIVKDLKKIDLRASSNLFEINAGGISVTASSIADYGKNFDGEKTIVSNNRTTTNSHKFTFIKTEEELEVELKSTKREITEVIVHWTETRTNQDIGSEYIQQTSKNIPYHYLIRRDGSLQRGRPIDKAGGSLNNGHEKYSIQIALVGGINAPTGIKNVDNLYSASSFTRKQMLSFQMFLKQVYNTWPGTQVLGHNDIDRQEIDPGFDVISFTENNFNKTVVYKDPSTEKPLNREQLIKTRVPY